MQHKPIVYQCMTMVYVTNVYQLYGMFTCTHVNIPYKNSEYKCLPNDEPM